MRPRRRPAIENVAGTRSDLGCHDMEQVPEIAWFRVRPFKCAELQDGVDYSGWPLRRESQNPMGGMPVIVMNPIRCVPTPGPRQKPCLPHWPCELIQRRGAEAAFVRENSYESMSVCHAGRNTKG